MPVGERGDYDKLGERKNISPYHLGKKMKWRREKGDNVKERKEKGRKGKKMRKGEVKG
jgi:hypothetical protein